MSDPLHTQIRKHREKSGISIRALADLTGLSFANIGVYMIHGTRLSHASVEKLCDALGIEMRALPFGEYEKMEEMILRQANEILELKRRANGIES